MVKHTPVWTQKFVYHTNENSIKQLDKNMNLFYLVYTVVYFVFVNLTLSCLLCNLKSYYWKVWQIDREYAWLCGLITLYYTCAISSNKWVDALFRAMWLWLILITDACLLQNQLWILFLQIGRIDCIIWLHVFCCVCRTFGGGVHAAGLLLQWGGQGRQRKQKKHVSKTWN